MGGGKPDMERDDAGLRAEADQRRDKYDVSYERRGARRFRF